jgi:SprT-like family
MEFAMAKRGEGQRLNSAETTPSLERQQWLEHAVEALRGRFTDAGYTVPQKIRVSIGWPKRSASCGHIGECWATEASSDRHAELFISPGLMEGARILDVLAHEMTHATTPGDGHGRLFKRCALAIGLQGPMRSTTGGLEFMAWAETLFKRIGPYPAGFLTDSPKQGTRMRKCECLLCGYTARVARKWITQAGPPICPTDRVALVEREALAKTTAHADTPALAQA